MPRSQNLFPNVAAFLDMIAYSEGTKGKGDDGYNEIVGGTFFKSYSDHPRQIIQVNKNLKSSAAGRYQELIHNFDVYKNQLHLSDFSPIAQDAIAIQQIKECKAFQLIVDGYIQQAIMLCAHIWASFPGAGYNQHENKIDNLIAKFKEFGGTVKS